MQHLTFYISKEILPEAIVNLRKRLQKAGAKLTEKAGDLKTIHVVSRFEGNDFRILSDLNCNLCALDCLNQSLDQLKPPLLYPVVHRAFEGLCICSTGIRDAERDKLAAAVEAMAGKFVRDLVQETTHLIASSSAPSDKFRTARSLAARIQIARPDWVFDSLKQGKRLPENLYAVRLFTGCVISVAGLSNNPKIRSEIESDTIKRGGDFSADLHQGCTHLVLDTSAPALKLKTKFEFAVKFGMFVVPLEWFRKCIETDTRLAESEYEIASLGLSQSQGPLTNKSGIQRTNSNGSATAAGVRKRKLSESTGSESVDGCSVVSGPTEEDSLAMEDYNRKRQRTTSNSAVPAGKNDMPILPLRTAPQNTTSAGENAVAMETDKPAPAVKLFQGITFLLSKALPQAETEALQSLVQEHGGMAFVEDDETFHIGQSAVKLHYILCPHGDNLGRFSKLTNGASTSTVVSPDWLNLSIRESTLLDCAECPLFVPLPRPLEFYRKELRTATLMVSVTGFSATARTALRHSLEATGATYTDRFSRKNTHLICQSPTGEKYKKAIEWKSCHLVTIEWWYNSLKRGERLSETDYAVSPPPSASNAPNAAVPVVDDVDMAMMMAAEAAEHKHTAAKQAANNSNGSSNNNNSTNAMITIPSVDDSDMQMADIAAVHLRSAVEFTEPAPPPPMSTSNDRVALWAVAAGVATTSVLSGVVIYVSKRLESQRQQLHEIVQSLGGEFTWAFDAAITTHYILQLVGNAKDNSSEYKAARSRQIAGKMYIVSPLWLIECHERGQRLPEAAFPVTLNPRRTLRSDVLAAVPTTLSSSQISSTTIPSSSAASSTARLRSNRSANSLNTSGSRTGGVAASQSQTRAPPLPSTSQRTAARTGAISAKSAARASRADTATSEWDAHEAAWRHTLSPSPPEVAMATMVVRNDDDVIMVDAAGSDIDGDNQPPLPPANGEISSTTLASTAVDTASKKATSENTVGTKPTAEKNAPIADEDKCAEDNAATNRLAARTGKAAANVVGAGHDVDIEDNDGSKIMEVLRMLIDKTASTARSRSSAAAVLAARRSAVASPAVSLQRGGRRVSRLELQDDSTQLTPQPPTEVNADAANDGDSNKLRHSGGPSTKEVSRSVSIGDPFDGPSGGVIGKRPNHGKAKGDTEEDVTDSQVAMVTYVDPAVRVARQQLAERLEKEKAAAQAADASEKRSTGQSRASVGSTGSETQEPIEAEGDAVSTRKQPFTNTAMGNKENVLNGAVQSGAMHSGGGSRNTTHNSHKYVFGLTGFTGVDKADVVRAIEQLGGIVDESNDSLNATHLIVNVPRATVKALLAAVRGAWLLTRRFIVDSEKAGRFLAEEPYELAQNLSNESIVDSKSANEIMDMAKTARRVRLTGTQANSGKLFAGVRAVLLNMDKFRKNGVSTVLRACGGEVVDAATAANDSSVTHVLIETDHRNGGVDPQILRTFRERKVHILKVLWVTDTLLKEKRPNLADYKL